MWFQTRRLQRSFVMTGSHSGSISRSYSTRRDTVNPFSAIVLALSVLLLIPAVVSAQPAKELPEVRIGMMKDGPWGKAEEVMSLFRQEILDILEGEFDVVFPDNAQLDGRNQADSIAGALNQLLADKTLDMVITVGPISSNLAGQRTDMPMPVIAPFVIDPEVQNVPLENGTSGVRNLCYVTSPWAVARDLEEFQEIVDFEKLAFMSSKVLAESVTELKQRMAAALIRQGFKAQVIRVGQDIDLALAELDDDVDAVYLGVLSHLPEASLDRLIDSLNSRKLPTFSMLGRLDVQRGVMAGTLPEDYFVRVARRTALNVQRILLGDQPGSIRVALPVDARLVINMGTARQVGVSPPWEVLTEAILINESRQEVSRALTLRSAVMEAVEVNLSLLAKQMEVSAGGAEVSKAWANLLPQVDVAGLYQVIDDDRAAASFGTQPEKTLAGQATVRQVLFSEQAWANVSIQKDLLRSREQELEAVRLDIIAATAQAYLNLLRAKTFEQIEKDNLRVTRQNLELAEVRQTIGTADQSEVLRWESQIATNRKSVIDANAQRNVAEIQLNRLLRRPMEESFSVAEPSLEDTDLLSADGRVFEYMSNPQSFRLLREFLEQEAVDRSPELAQLDRVIAARRRALTSNRLRYFLPDFSLQGEVVNIFDKSGAGSSSSGVGFGIEPPDDVNWTVSVVASLPLFEGGRLRANSRQTSRELEQLELTRSSAEDQVRQRIRSALHLTGASYAGIGLSRDAAAAADSTLSLVVDAYSRGVLSILDVIDAQNASLTANRAAANAVYDFLLDLIEVERAMGVFRVFATPADRAAFTERLETFYAENLNARD
ncbi:hypothetical protein GF377_03645 [candidate division GN15 bacterium]|nr:hypothetical protein [candidate division GN15 bacterium]